MADKTINQLTQATALTDSSLFVIEQNSTAKQAHWGMIKNYISPGVAEQYSSSATYDVGDYVIYNGQLYRCTTAITTGEAWTAAHWTAVVLGDDVGTLNRLLKYSFNETNLYKASTTSYNNNTALTNNGDGSYTVGITDYGRTVFGGTVTLKPGNYLLYGVPNGEAYLSTDGTAPNAIVKNTASTPKVFTISEEATLYLCFRITPTPSSSFTIVPFVYGTKTDAAIKSADKTKGFIESVDTASADESTKHDMRSAIQDMLDTYGYCRLGPGVFYISAKIIMPEGSTLEGSGEATELRLMSGNAKFAVLMKKYSTVNNLSIIGSYTDLTQSDFGESSGSRYGIHYYKGANDGYQTAYCSITNVHIRNFTGAGIYQYNTGANVEQGLFVSNVHIKNCWCGIHNYSGSEFCRYDNVQITYCYIACINNGGNNAFNNCVFHAYSIGMKIEGERSNSAHGMCANSSFCHTGNNAGSALTLSNIVNGYVFAACQFWYNSVDISNCEGIVFSGCEFGRGTTGEGATINISNGETIMFNGCVFMNDVSYPPDITITNNDKVKFSSCYGSKSGSEITG